MENNSPRINSEHDGKQGTKKCRRNRRCKTSHCGLFASLGPAPSLRLFVGNLSGWLLPSFTLSARGRLAGRFFGGGGVKGRRNTHSSHSAIAHHGRRTRPQHLRTALNWDGLRGAVWGGTTMLLRCSAACDERRLALYGASPHLASSPQGWQERLLLTAYVSWQELFARWPCFRAILGSDPLGPLFQKIVSLCQLPASRRCIPVWRRRPSPLTPITHNPTSYLLLPFDAPSPP
jgi:hypothetical protein